MHIYVVVLSLRPPSPPPALQVRGVQPSFVDGWCAFVFVCVSSTHSPRLGNRPPRAPASLPPVPPPPLASGRPRQPSAAAQPLYYPLAASTGLSKKSLTSRLTSFPSCTSTSSSAFRIAACSRSTAGSPPPPPPLSQSASRRPSVRPCPPPIARPAATTAPASPRPVAPAARSPGSKLLNVLQHPREDARLDLPLPARVVVG